MVINFFFTAKKKYLEVLYWSTIPDDTTFHMILIMMYVIYDIDIKFRNSLSLCPLIYILLLFFDLVNNAEYL
jgi:hypothetical protein